MTPPIAYAAHTPSCTFFLDEEGICRQIVRRAGPMTGFGKAADAIGRCIGAQYVASIDLATDGGLVAMPRVGSPMLFAYLGEAGRIALVRTGGLLRFEQKGPLAVQVARKHDSGVHEAPSDEDEEDLETQRFTLDASALARTAELPVPQGRPREEPEPRRGVLPRRRSR